MDGQEQYNLLFLFIYLFICNFLCYTFRQHSIVSIKIDKWFWDLYLLESQLQINSIRSVYARLKKESTNYHFVIQNLPKTLTVWAEKCSCTVEHDSLYYGLAQFFLVRLLPARSWLIIPCSDGHVSCFWGVDYIFLRLRFLLVFFGLVVSHVLEEQWTQRNDCALNVMLPWLGVCLLGDIGLQWI